jgi:hypothetical protein
MLGQTTHHISHVRIDAMRTFGFLGGKSMALREVPIPGSRLARVNQALKRRLDDEVEEVFHRACATSDFESAADLLVLLEKWHARRATLFGRERRISGANLQRARKELERLRMLHGAAVHGASPGSSAAA